MLFFPLIPILLEDGTPHHKGPAGNKAEVHTQFLCLHFDRDAQFLGPDDLLRLDLDVGGLSGDAAVGLVDHDLRVRQDVPPARRA